MQMFPIKGSTRFTHYGFEPNTGGPKGLGMLALTFHGGKTYWYRGVPESLFENFLMAYSKGSFFSKFISDKFQHIQGE